MSLIASPPASAPAAGPGEASAPKVYRLSVDQYHQMIRAGILAEDHRVELVDGQLITKMTKNERHIAAVKLVNRALDRAVPAGWHVAKEDPVVIEPYDEPEPDLSVVRGDIRDYLARKPGPRDVALVVEVSDTSYPYDRSKKLALYAASAIVIAWILNLPDRRLEVYSDPIGPAEAPGYRRRQDYGPDEEVPLLLDGREVARFAVRDLLP